MNAPRRIALLLALLLSAGTSTAHAPAPEWLSYRDAYRAMVMFQKYGGPKHYLQNQLQLVSARQGAVAPDLRLILQTRDGDQYLALDPTGRAAFPLSTAAYNENAPLLVSGGAGPVGFRARVSIVPRANGLYDSAELRAACGQALDYLRYTDTSARARACVGVRFVYPHEGTAAAAPAPVRLRSGAAEAVALPVTQGGAFPDDGQTGFRIVNYRFSHGAEANQLITSSTPLAITPLIE
ncbi:hypothetical protein IV454_16675 [Massilia antarctica]|uniref:DUF2987 domain-containing protein n=1 Tax=Massilia antarctica TaxID=2765360 RepID=A0AA48WIJ9_9BURK|nr:hypothetical protein [Massilia antarctica]QPI52977.1 hypothetical protein IV454_16675 [Massilia antarctica]